MAEALHERLHATAVAVAGRAVLLRGASGAGKSDLALRMLAVTAPAFVAEPPCLVSDDIVLAEAVDGRVRLTSPPLIAGRIEVRGLGIVAVPSVLEAALVLVIDLVAANTIERMPVEMGPATICGVAVRRLQLFPFEPSAPLKALLALAGVAGAN